MISYRRQGYKPFETHVKIWVRSNGRIRSYVPIEPVLLCGTCSCLTRRCWCRVAILVRRQGKQPLETHIKIWERSNSRITSYVPLEPVLLCGPWSCLSRRCWCRVAILVRRQGKQPLETHVKIWERSNGRINSYVPLEPVSLSGSWCGLSRCLGCRVAILVRRQGKQPLETQVKIWARSNGRIKS